MISAVVGRARRKHLEESGDTEARKVRPRVNHQTSSLTFLANESFRPRVGKPGSRACFLMARELRIFTFLNG